MKILFMTNIPSPYRVDFFNELGKYCELTVMFENQSANSRNKEWKNYEFINFQGLFLGGIRYGEAERFCPSAIKIIKNGTFDKIIVGMYSSLTGIYTIRYLIKHHIPYIISTDGGVIKETKGVKWMIKCKLIGSAAAWLSTGEMSNRYLVNYGADIERIYVYPFSSIKERDILNRPLNSIEKNEIRNKLGLVNNKIIVMSVGQLIHRKGYDILEKSANKLQDFEFYIIGGKAVNRENVHYIDFMKKEIVYEYLKAADIFVLPTREDIWGLVINEAMSMGLPIVTTNKCNAGIEMVKNGVNGYIVPSNNEAELADAIKKAIEIDGMNSIKIANEYSIESMVRKHLEFFDR